jgi:hypothetical protein
VEEEQPLITREQSLEKLFFPLVQKPRADSCRQESALRAKSARKTTVALLLLRAEPLPAAEDMFKENTL